MNGTITAKLSDLIHFDRALLEMYRYAIPLMSNDSAAALSGVVEDHQRHESWLADACAEAEIEISEPDEEVEALIEQHARLLRSALDETSLLETLSLAEHANSVLCRIAADEDLPEGVDDIVTEQHADERLHVSILTERMPSSGQLTDPHDGACVTGGITDDRSPDDFE